MMKVFVLLVFVMLAGVPLGVARTTTAAPSEWTAIVGRLNEHLEQPPSNSSVSKDLLKLYKGELKLIQDAWVAQKIEKDREYNKKKNTFYMNAIDQKNNESFVEVQKTATVSSATIDEAFMQSILDDATAYSFIDRTQPTTTEAEIAIGFCFYKALMVHYFLLQRGVAPKNIRKVFAVGPLVYQPLVWKFHVAVAVQANGKVWVIDPLVKRLASLEEWKTALQNFSAEKPFPRLRFFVTEPQKFLPNSNEYSLELIEHKKTKKYNPAFLKYLKKKGQLNN